MPNDGKPHPGLVILHGSDGGASGWNEMEAIKWAQKGFAVMPYAYFGAGGTPPGLGLVDLNLARSAIGWLKSSPQVNGKKVGLYGVSRGAEMSVALTSFFPRSDLISALVAHSPQDKAMGSITVLRDGELDAVRDRWGYPVPAWQAGGRPIADGTPFPLEQFGRPIFLTHGTADEIWSVDGTRQLEARLKWAGQRHTVRYLPGEGHALSPAVEAEVDAQRLAFFRTHLGL